MERHSPRAVRRARRIARLAGALAGVLAAVFYGLFIIRSSPDTLGANRIAAESAFAVICAAGLAAGAFAGPLLTVDPFLWLEDALDTTPPGELIGGVIGLLVALVVAALVGALLGGIPGGGGTAISVVLAAALVYIGVRAGMRRRVDISAFASHLGRRNEMSTPAFAQGPPPQDGPPVVVDTSVLIDGRIVDVSRSGFIPGRLVIPEFVVEELQRVADAGDPVRRAKGRRGLSVLEELKESPDIVCEIVEASFPGTPEVDAKLVKLARLRQAAIMTNDYNLNRLAQVEGVRVLNLNDLANAVKPIVSTGETMRVTVVKEGKEPHQGVAYLEDGTMVVVENGRRHIDESFDVTVTSILQTPAGRMIFAAAPSTDDGRARPVRAARPPRVVNR